MGHDGGPHTEAEGWGGSGLGAERIRCAQSVQSPQCSTTDRITHAPSSNERFVQQRVECEHSDLQQHFVLPSLRIMIRPCRNGPKGAYVAGIELENKRIMARRAKHRRESRK